jgi:predicted RND superfamily exporter protein
MRARADQAQSEQPGFRVTFTGTPAITVEEMGVVRRDTLVAAGVAVVGVTLLTFFVFRWKSHALLVLLALAAGVLWSFGAVRLELGYLNMITSSFISTLVGVGVAYGIHPVSEYELQGAHTGDPVEAVRRAWNNTGAAVATAAVTTAAAFFSILLMRFPGFAEMGLVAGFGVLLCLLAALVTLPALVALYGRRRAAQAAAAGRRRSMVDRLWVGRASGAVCRFPRAVSLLALAVSLLALAGARGIGFNNNILDMLPANSDALRAIRQMTEGSDLSPVFNMVVADDVEQLHALRDRAAGEPSIERFESVLRLLPENPERSVAALGRLEELAARVSFPPAAGSVSRAGLRASLERLLDALDAAADSAFGAGVGEMLEPLEDCSAEVEAALSVVEAAPASAEAAWQDGQARLHGEVRELLDRLNRMVRAAPPELDGLPTEMKRRFVTGSGRLIAYLYPNGNVFDSELLEEYVAASRRVDPQAIGFPTMFWKTSHRITSGFYKAVLVGLVLVALILVVDYRNLRDAALAMIPLLMGIVWMLGGMRLLGLDFNFANLVAVPLIIGVGIDNGVHVIHRMRHEGEAGMEIVLQHTGRAILIAGLTTMIGFGSLALASHRGIQSLGLLLLLGVGACLLTATIVLPNLLIALGIAKR